MVEFVETVFAFAAKGKDAAKEGVDELGSKTSEAADIALNMFRNARGN